jgi:prepilin-type N-terminal cleavage/methylation domain-containing protein
MKSISKWRGPTTRARRGFTLVELLVVIAIIGILIALLLPAVQAAREAARRAQCTNNLKQISLSLHNYHDVNKCFPPGVLPYEPPTRTDGDPRAHRQAGWLVRILPYLEQGAAYDQMTFDGVDWTIQHGVQPNSQILDALRVDALNCPSSNMNTDRSDNDNLGNTFRYQLVNYAGIGGTYLRGSDLATHPTPSYAGYGGGRTTYNGVIVYADQNHKPAAMKSIVDGTSNTFCVGEQSSPYIDANGNAQDWRACNHDGGAWSCGAGGTTANHGVDWWLNVTIVRYPINYNPPSAPAEANAGYRRHTIIRSEHPGGAQLALTDGSVRFVSETVDFQTFIRLCDREDRQPVGSF